ncbi:hypothetical protein JFL47_03985 [Haemophilus haemoglobinophilus]|nr:hypothetical protein [Canicola haemoglobinophilus]
MKKHLFKLATLTLLVSPMAMAEQGIQANQHNTVAAEQNLNTVELVDNVTGVSYEVDENGEFARIRAVGEAELEIGDRKDIRTATQKAQMRAKANIAKFLSERVASNEVLDEIEKQVNNSNGKNKEVSRETLSTYTENIQNSAEALLKGVIATKSEVNKDEKFVSVEMGISLNTLRAADTLGERLKENHADGKKNNSQNLNGGGREVKKAKNYDNF